MCFTGFRDKNLEKQIIEGGGNVMNTISKHTDILVVLDINKKSSKISKAKSLNVKIVSKEEFVMIY